MSPRDGIPCACFNEPYGSGTCEYHRHQLDQDYARSMNVLLERIADLEGALKRIYLGSGVGIQSARAIAKNALYGEDE